ncbi:uncharacterized protein ARMOST_15261 [Armillaria ostoyae]|uniref:Uncharacterized protein n=1 Tax=Armillaria ostoyae TaxID=47428 RepID=A0A284RSY0_ARMOS|nr:uncharacterized protein ARMOST_15261 [Armillaria ostoyae]
MPWTLKTRANFYSSTFNTLPTPPTLILQDLLKESAAFENENASAYEDDLDDTVGLGSDVAHKCPVSDLDTGTFPDEIDDIPQHKVPRPVPLPIDPHATPYRMSHRNVKRSNRCKASSQTPTAKTIGKVISGSLARATASRVLESTIELSTLGVAHGGYAAKAETPYGAKKKYSADELVNARGFQYISWDGKTPRPIVDKNGVIFAVLAGRPDDPTYLQAADEMYKKMEAESRAANVKARSNQPHHRGLFTAVNVGLSYGKGQPAPSMLNIQSDYTDFIWRLILQPSVQRIAAFASGHRSTCGVPDSLHITKTIWIISIESWEQLPYFLGRFFPALLLTLAGTCRFDATAGAHLVLWELKMIIEFLHGATIFIPSATITHSNTAPAPGDQRLSFTQFCAGGLLRWVDNGFHMEEVLRQEDPEAYEAMQEAKNTQWKLGLGLYSSVDELLTQIPE